MRPRFFLFAFALAILLAALPARAAEPAAIPPERRAYVESLIKKATDRRLYLDRQWLLLLHDRPDGAGGFESEADGRPFFLAPDGKTSPRAELIATLTAFGENRVAPSPPRTYSVESQPEPVGCRFGARWKFLSKALEFDPALLPSPACTDFDAWRAEIDPDSVTLVFASSFIGSPASTYGHTFLRLDKRGMPMVLLSQAVEFAAIPTTSNPIAYSVMGLFGGFQGRFYARPYFSKVQEYSNLESRDLWEYRLKFDDDAIDTLLRHLWELDVTYFDYYFASQNCSYQLMTVLDVVFPDKHLAEEFPGTTAPADTVRAVLRAGLVEKRTVRPSAAGVMLARRNTLTGPEIAMAENIANVRLPVETPELLALSDDRKAAVLDAAFDLFKHRYGFFAPKGTTPKPRVAAHETALEAERGRIHIGAVMPEFPVGTAPEDGHFTSRVGVVGRAVGSNRETPYVEEVHFRLALHDLLDVQTGYPPDTQLEMLTGSLRIDPTAVDRKASFDTISVERFDFVNIASIAPQDRWVHPISRRFIAGFGRVPMTSRGMSALEPVCRGGWGCEAADVDVGVGEAVAFHFPFSTTWYTFADANPGAGPAFTHLGWRVGGYAAAGTLWQPFPFLRMRGEARLRVDPLGDRGPDTKFDPFFKTPSLKTIGKTDPNTQIDTAASLSFGKDRELRVGTTWIRGTPDVWAGLFLCF